ncbi:MAG: 30S ribosomal protein S16 [Bdellovibrionales bacterium]
MVVIRLARFGKKHSPKYRVTVADSRRWLNGKCIEVIGHYDPRPVEGKKPFDVDMEKFNSWVSKGAQPSDRVKSLVRKAQG